MAIPIWILTGPTASGKTDIAIKIARDINAEIVSADSMLVYRGMDIGTEKPSFLIRNEIPHHLIDIVEPWDEYSVGRYVKDFKTIVKNLYQRNKPFLVVGGTALYIKAIMDGLFEGPAADWNYRSYLHSIANERGTAYLHELLAVSDPETAEKLHYNDRRRIIRALEVIKKTGKRISSFQTQFGHKNPNYRCTTVAIEYDRDVLYKRIDARVDRMIERGLLSEVQRLVKHPKGLSRQASQALGYKEVIDFLHGNYSFTEVVDEIKRKTRRFAKRQMTWLRKFQDIYTIHVYPDTDTVELSRRILSLFTVNTPELSSGKSYKTLLLS